MSNFYPAAIRLAAWACLLAVGLPAAPALAQKAETARGAGPFTVQTTKSTFNARLLRLDKDTLWVLKDAETGTGFFEAGIPLAELTAVIVPRPRVFDVAEQATAPAQIKLAQETLDKIILMLKPFRALPGMNADEAIILKGHLLDRQGLWREAVRQYEDVLAQPYDTEMKTLARLRAGIAYELAGKHAEALQFLKDAPVPEDDLELLSAAYFARASAFAGLGQHKDALLNYLFLVVFHPFVQNNELRCLEASILCYEDMKDWESLYKTMQYMTREYPQAKETKRAKEICEENREEMIRAGQFIDGEQVVEAGAETTPAEAPADGQAVEEKKSEE